MGKLDKILTIILSGASDNNIPFSDLRHIVKALGFNERIKGDHFITAKLMWRKLSTCNRWVARQKLIR
jgi:hypothetical protein